MRASQTSADSRLRRPSDLPEDEESGAFATTTPGSPRFARDLLPDSAPFAPTDLNKTQFFWNGMACYRDPSSTLTYAAACNMRATPLQAFQHFVRLSDGSSGWNVFDDVTVLASDPTVDADLVRTQARMAAG